MYLVLKGTEMFVKASLDDTDVDVSNIANWWRLIDNKGFSMTYVFEQINEYVKKAGGVNSLNDYDRVWYDYVKTKTTR